MAPLTDISRAFGQQSPEPISRTMQYRKVTKPLLERQRRARINRCLDELKDILVAGLNNDGENVARLEKADILELTVRHLQKLTVEQNRAASAKSLGEDNRFRAGFATCVQEISRILATTKVDVQLGSSLMIHLGHSLNQITSQSQCQSSTMVVRQSPSPTSSTSSSRPASACSADYRPYTPPASPQSSEISSSHSHLDKSVWRPW